MLCWTLHLKGGPGLRNHPAVAVEHELYCFCNGVKPPIDVHVFNTVSLSWRKLHPVRRGKGEHRLEVASNWGWGYTAVLIEDIIYIWGGLHTEFDNKDLLCAFDVDTHRWSAPRVSGTFPKVRYNHSTCVLGKVMFIHGGWTQLTGRTNDIYKLDTSTMVWSLINTKGTAPIASDSHSATIIGTKMFVFGGKGLPKLYHYNTIRVFDTETNCWLNFKASEWPHPVGRCAHSAFAYNGELYIFGGCNVSQTFSDLWKFNPESFSWKKVEPKGKGPSEKDGMCCCTVGNRIFFFGGFKTRKELYILDLGRPSLKTLCKLAVIQYGLEQSGLPHNIRWELAAMV